MAGATVLDGEMFGRHVEGSPEEVSGPGQGAEVAIDLAGEPEVEDDGAIPVGHHDVAGLDVAVNHARLVGGIQRPRGHRAWTSTSKLHPTYSIPRCTVFGPTDGPGKTHFCTVRVNPSPRTIVSACRP